MNNLKKFVGDYAYSYIKNIAVNQEKLKSALVTSRNARNVFSELDEFQIKAICSEISSNDTFGIVRETTQAEIIEDFKKAGYDTVIFDDKDKIAECEKYYADGEKICTYNNLSERMKQYHMLVAIKKNIDKIQRSKNPQREDEYGTSILNIQIAKNGSHMSIKNRYNHTVRECDSTLNNNLDLLIPGLQAKVLGYYNIAFLNKKKGYYKDIVNINGIYLKYEREVDNIYFGDFVLDSKNGVRFTDHSRYYIAFSDDKFEKNPYVLDFKNKKVTEGNQISKVSLLNRAMKEGLLHSGNKENADKLNIIFPNALNELLQCRRKALQYIAYNYGYDFQKPFKITGLLGNFTANSIKKMTESNNGILLVCDETEVKCVKFINGKFDIIDTKNYGYSINYFWTKGEFEADRKSGRVGVFIVQQDKKYIREVPRAKTERQSSFYRYNRNDEYDKSGCNLTEARRQLESRLNKYVADKNKREVDAVRWEPELREIEEMFQALKAKLVFKLNKAQTAEEYNCIEKIFNYRFVWLANDIEKFKTKATAKEFRSVEQATNNVTSIKERIIEKLNNLKD